MNRVKIHCIYMYGILLELMKILNYNKKEEGETLGKVKRRGLSPVVTVFRTAWECTTEGKILHVPLENTAWATSTETASRCWN